MSTTVAVLDEPVPVTRHRRASFNEEIELADLRDVEKDSKAGNEDIVSAPKTPEVGSVISVANERLYLAVLCWGFLVWGWNDGTLGPLLPTIQKNYNVGYATVSLLFVCSTIGCISGSFSVVWLSNKLGFGKNLVLAASILTLGFALTAAAAPFPVMCIAFLVIGFAMALQGATAQAFVASIPRNSSTNMGLLHAAYGLGAFAAPLVSTQFAQMKRWSFHYLISMGVALASLALAVGVFRLKRQDDLIPVNESAEKVALKTTYKQIFTQKLVITLAFFILVYVGIEVSIGGWIVTFLIRRRGGGPSTGYVSSGFFGGLMVGRVILLPVNQKLGKRRVIYIYTAFVIALQFTVWFVPSLIQNAIAVSFVGLFLGPVYPVSINVAAGMLPAWLLAGAIGFIAAFGQAGSALFPFMTGAIASKYGVQVLQPIMVPLMFTQMVLWYLAMHLKVSRIE